MEVTRTNAMRESPRIPSLRTQSSLFMIPKGHLESNRFIVRRNIIIDIFTGAVVTNRHIRRTPCRHISHDGKTICLEQDDTCIVVTPSTGSVMRVLKPENGSIPCVLRQFYVLDFKFDDRILHFNRYGGIFERVFHRGHNTMRYNAVPLPPRCYATPDGYDLWVGAQCYTTYDGNTTILYPEDSSSQAYGAACSTNGAVRLTRHFAA